MKFNVSLIGVIIILVAGYFFGKSYLDEYYGDKLKIAHQNATADSTTILRLKTDSADAELFKATFEKQRQKALQDVRIEVTTRTANIAGIQLRKRLERE